MAVNLRGRGRSPEAKDGLRCLMYIVDNKCYIPTGMKNACYLSYLTFDTTSYQSQELKDKLVRMTQPVLSL